MRRVLWFIAYTHNDIVVYEILDDDTDTDGENRQVDIDVVGAVHAAGCWKHQLVIA